MLRFFSNETDVLIDRQMGVILKEMDIVGVNSDEYNRLLSQLERLGEVKGSTRRNFVSKDTLVISGVGFLQTIAILMYEEKHVLTSKALGQVMRAKT